MTEAWDLRSVIEDFPVEERKKERSEVDEVGELVVVGWSERGKSRSRG